MQLNEKQLNCHIYFYINLCCLYLPELENLIKHSCNHGLLLSMAKARLTDCNINRNFPVSEKKKKKGSIFTYDTLFTLF